MKRAIIEGFEHSPGKNCGSTSLWNLAKFYGNDIEEHNIFGLASGLLFFYMKNGFGGAEYSIGGRNPLLVKDFFENSGIDKEWETYNYFPKDKIKKYIDEKVPVLARTDLYYLPYYPKPVHFPGHELVIFGYEETENGTNFIVSDSSFQEPQKVSEKDLANAMNPPEKVIAFFELENHIMPVEKFYVKFDRESIIKSISKVVFRMLKVEQDFMGLKAMRKFADTIEMWAESKNVSWTLRFAYQVIERRGTGGGSFRYMYSDFLKDSSKILGGKEGEILKEAGEIMLKSAEKWRQLAFKLKELSEKPKVEKEDMQIPKKLAGEIYLLEKESFEKIEHILR
jgi:hypothetical protein